MNFSSYLVHIPLYFGSSNFPLSNQGCYQWSTIYWDVKWKANVSIKHSLWWAVKGILKNKNIILIGRTLIETRYTNTAVADYCMSYFKTIVLQIAWIYILYMFVICASTCIELFVWTLDWDRVVCVLCVIVICTCLLSCMLYVMPSGALIWK